MLVKVNDIERWYAEDISEVVEATIMLYNRMAAHGMTKER